MARLLALLPLALLGACDNPCQAVCVEMASYAEECGCDVSSEEIQTCRAANAQPTDAEAQECLTSSDPQQLREWWSCEDLKENYQSCSG